MSTEPAQEAFGGQSGASRESAIAVPVTEKAGPRRQASFGLSAGSKAPMKDVRKPDLIDYWTRFARLRAISPGWWLGPLGWALVGAGLATWSADPKAHLESFSVGGLLVIGALCVACHRIVTAQETENLKNICNDFGRYLTRWSEGPDHEMSEEYRAFLEEVDKVPARKKMLGLL
jgi:hypothetical protein